VIQVIGRRGVVCCRAGVQAQSLFLCVSVCACVCLCVSCVCVSVCLCLPVHQAWGEAPVVRGQGTEEALVGRARVEMLVESQYATYGE